MLRRKFEFRADYRQYFRYTRLLIMPPLLMNELAAGVNGPPEYSAIRHESR